MSNFKVNNSNETINFNGFGVQPGFIYGEDTETGRLVASSGWTCNKSLRVYDSEKGISQWSGFWVDFEDLRDSNLEGSLSFSEWLDQKEREEAGEFEEEPV